MRDERFHVMHREQLGLAPSDYKPLGDAIERMLLMTRRRRARAAPSRGLGIKAGWRGAMAAMKYSPETGLMVPGSLCARDNVRIIATTRLIASSLDPTGSQLLYQDIKCGSGLTLPAQSDSDMETEIASVALTVNDGELSDDPPIKKYIGTFVTDEANGENSEFGLFMDSAAMAAHANIGRGDIVNATQTNPVVIDTAGAHSLADSDRVAFTGVQGMTDLNGNYYYVNVTDANSFELYSDEDLSTSVNGTGFGAFSSPPTGEFVKVLLVSNPEFLVVTWELTY